MFLMIVILKFAYKVNMVFSKKIHLVVSFYQNK